MKKQILVGTGALLIVASLFFFGRTVADKPKKGANQPQKALVQAFSISDFINDAKKRLTTAQAITLSKFENNITRGDIPAQKIAAFNQLAAFWKDSAHVFEPYAWYISEAAMLDKSEKNLTFAAQLFLDNLRSEPNESVLAWKSDRAVSLFEEALKISPDKDELKIGLGSSYIFGRGRSGNPEETMKGIQTLLSVVRKDSTNMKAQLALGIGGFVSGQYDKAIDRLTKVVKAEPDNMEAVAFLADAYAAKGDKINAVKWYEASKRMVNNPEYTKEVDERIKQLK